MLLLPAANVCHLCVHSVIAQHDSPGTNMLSLLRHKHGLQLHDSPVHAYMPCKAAATFFCSRCHGL